MKKLLLKFHWLLAAFSLSFFLLPDATNASRPENAPRLANINYMWSINSSKEVTNLARYDVLVIDVENAHYSLDRLKAVKRKNPDIKILAYISMTDLLPDAADLDEGTMRKELGEKIDATPEWVLKNSNGNQVYWWSDYTVFNVTNNAPKVNGERFNDYFPQLVREKIISKRVFDGVFYDNLWEGGSFIDGDIDLNQNGAAESAATVDREWREGTKKILKRTKSLARSAGRRKFIVTGNGGTAYNSNVQGVMFEHFPDDTVYGNWTNAMEKYQFILRNAIAPRYIILNTNGNNRSNARTNYKKMRYGLMSTLVFGNRRSFYSYDKGDQSHREQWYYDEYDVNLGEAVSSAYNVLRKDDPRTKRKGVWRRDYERATVFVNSTNKKKKLVFKTRYEKLKGTQAKKVNSGKNAGSITLKPKDGIILLRRLRLVSNITFINGAQAKVFNKKGKKVRNSFFSYDGNYPAGAQVHRIAITKKNGKTKRSTVVADGPYVKVYNKNGRLLRQWAPYGEGYTGTVNISVGQAKKKRKRFIVTGRSTDIPEVKTFTLKGKQKNSCVPYDAAFRGGVNVGTGNLRGGRRDEIVVSAAFGGGPHVRILNAKCKLIDPGFFAFSRDLRNGVNMAVGNVDGRGKPEIITATGAGSSPKVRIYRKKGKKWKKIGKTFRPYSKSDTSGVLVSTADIDDNGTDDIVTSSFSIFNSF
jgi:hypothetical protein